MATLLGGRQALPTEEPEEVDIDFIAYETVTVSPDVDLRPIARRVLGRAMGSADLGSAGYKTTYGNLDGRNLLEDKYNDSERITRLEATVNPLREDVSEHRNQLTEQQHQLTEHQCEIADLQNRVKVLTKTSEGYQKIWERFLDSYERDVLKRSVKEGQKRIWVGNEAAHEGDAIADADLYITGKRHDENLFVSLYGLTPNQVSGLAAADQHDTIAALNTGATWTSKGDVPADVHTALQAFIRDIEKDFGGNVTDGASSLSRAYYTFLGAHRKNRENWKNLKNKK